MVNLNRSRDITLLTKVHIVKVMVLPIVMFGCETGKLKKKRKGWVTKNWCFWTVVLEKSIEGLLDSKEIKQVIPKGNQLWIVIGRTDTEAPIPDGKLNSIIDTMGRNLSKLWDIVKDEDVVHGVTKSWTQLGDWISDD